MTVLEYSFEDEIFRAEAVRRDLPWGNGIDVTIRLADDKVWRRAAFRCHPEFLDYARFQAMETAQLLEEAVKLLKSGGHAVMQNEGRQQIFFRLNEPGLGQLAAQRRVETQDPRSSS